MCQIYFILGWHSTCFRRSFRPSSWVQDYIQQQAYVKQILLSASKQRAVSVLHKPVAVCTVLNSWWRTERPSETCRESFQNEINLIHLVHLVGFTTEIIHNKWSFCNRVYFKVWLHCNGTLKMVPWLSWLGYCTVTVSKLNDRLLHSWK